MQPMVISYTVGIRRRFLPIFKKFKVVGHDTEILGAEPRLLLNLLDGSQLAVPGIARRIFKVYPDYRNAEIQLQRLRAGPEVVQHAPSGTDLFDDLLRKQQGG